MNLLGPMEWLQAPLAGVATWAWVLFILVVLLLLALDLGVFHRGEREIGLRESLWTSLFYILAALGFGAWIWSSFGSDAGLKFLTGYVIEKSLSLDNIFVISLIFGYLAIPQALQHRVLFWGILGVLVMRALLIGAGTALVHEFAWLLPVFGVLLLAAAFHMVREGEITPTHAQLSMVTRLRQLLRVTDTLHGRAFWVRMPDPDESGRVRLYATPLFLALVLVEAADAVFALESVPAVLAITQEPYLVYTSNVFAVLGLRALYFALAAMIARLAYLKYSLALVLGFIGGKILYQTFGGHVPPLVSLCVTLAIMAGGVALSLWRRRDVRLTLSRSPEA